MDTHIYIEVPEAFALEKNGRKFNDNEFLAVQTLDGRWVTSINSMQEFPITFAQLMATGWEPLPEEIPLGDFVNQ